MLENPILGMHVDVYVIGPHILYLYNSFHSMHRTIFILCNAFDKSNSTDSTGSVDSTNSTSSTDLTDLTDSTVIYEISNDFTKRSGITMSINENIPLK